MDILGVYITTINTHASLFARIPSEYSGGLLCYSPCGNGYANLYTVNYFNVWAIKEAGDQGVAIQFYKDANYMYCQVPYGNPVIFIGPKNRVLNIDSVSSPLPSGVEAITVQK